MTIKRLRRADFQNHPAAQRLPFWPERIINQPLAEEFATDARPPVIDGAAALTWSTVWAPLIGGLIGLANLKQLAAERARRALTSDNGCGLAHGFTASTACCASAAIG